MQVDPETVSSDSYIMNLQIILFHFCEPFMDAQYSKVGETISHPPCFHFNDTCFQMDRIDPLYYAHSSRIDLSDETRINATSEEAEGWRKQSEAVTGKSQDVIDTLSC